MNNNDVDVKCVICGCKETITNHDSLYKKGWITIKDKYICPSCFCKDSREECINKVIRDIAQFGATYDDYGDDDGEYFGCLFCGMCIQYDEKLDSQMDAMRKIKHDPDCAWVIANDLIKGKIPR